MSDFIAGLFVGIAEVSIGHPFDTTKILIQNNRPWWGLSLSKYYRGWRFPLWHWILPLNTKSDREAFPGINLCVHCG